MAGKSSRFYKAGYKVPKYALKIEGMTVFELALNSFKNYFDDDYFVFVVRRDSFSVNFVQKHVCRLGIVKYDIVELEHDTKGQAETAYYAINNVPGDYPVLIFNIDTFRYNYIKPEFISLCDGYLEVFKGVGDHWSFIVPESDQKVLRTTEKQRVSDLCSDGLYYFKSKKMFCECYEDALKENDTVKGEFYIAPLYNRVINKGGVVMYDLIDLKDVDFCGTPEEYSNLLRKA